MNNPLKISLLQKLDSFKEQISHDVYHTSKEVLNKLPDEVFQITTIHKGKNSIRLYWIHLGAWCKITAGHISFFIEIVTGSKNRVYSGTVHHYTSPEEFIDHFNGFLDTRC